MKYQKYMKIPFKTLLPLWLDLNHHLPNPLASKFETCVCFMVNSMCTYIKWLLHFLLIALPSKDVQCNYICRFLPQIHKPMYSSLPRKTTSPPHISHFFPFASSKTMYVIFPIYLDCLPSKLRNHESKCILNYITQNTTVQCWQ